MYMYMYMYMLWIVSHVSLTYFTTRKYSNADNFAFFDSGLDPENHKHASYRKRQHAATHCNTLQHTTTHFNTLHHTTTHYNTLQHNASHCSTHYNTLQHIATRCNTLQHAETHYNTLQHTATHCNTLQHNATHCNKKNYKYQWLRIYSKLVTSTWSFWWTRPSSSSSSSFTSCWMPPLLYVRMPPVLHRLHLFTIRRHGVGGHVIWCHVCSNQCTASTLPLRKFLRGRSPLLLLVESTKVSK